MQVAWSSSMGMDIAQAPAVSWISANVCDHTLVDTPQGTVSDLDNCVEDSADSSGVIEVVWRDSFSSSKFARALSKYRSWLTASTFDVDQAMVDNADRALVAAGM